MVNKMKLNLFLAALFCNALVCSAQAIEVAPEQVLSTDVVRCGTDLSVNTYAYKKDGKWQGFDADMCRVFAWAILGDGEKFKLVDTRSYQAVKALKSGLIDVMLSGGNYSIAMQARGQAEEIGLLYYDRQMFAAKDAPENVKSMEDFKNKKVCVSANAYYLDNLKAYNAKYKLHLHILPFNSPDKARTAFLLKRCELLSGKGTILKGMMYTGPQRGVRVLPEEFAYKPVYAFVSPQNPDFVTKMKWIINALYLAEEKGINKDNVADFEAGDDESVRNLLGQNKQIWKYFNLNPDWVNKAIAAVGNMGEIYDRNLGPDSRVNLSRGQANLIKNGGIIYAKEFK